MLDNKDQQLLVALQSQARMSVSELANTINLSDTPTLRRIKKLEQVLDYITAQDGVWSASAGDILSSFRAHIITVPAAE